MLCVELSILAVGVLRYLAAQVEAVEMPRIAAALQAEAADLRVPMLRLVTIHFATLLVAPGVQGIPRTAHVRYAITPEGQLWLQNDSEGVQDG